jgi:hypothetical protein
MVLCRWTLATALRRPLVLVMAALGCFALWGGVSLEILALGEGSRSLELGVATAEGVALVVAVLLAARVLEEDELTGYGEALDGGGAGYLSRLTGRYLGVWAAALASTAPVLVLSVVLYNQVGHGPVPRPAAWAPGLVLEVGVAAGWTVWLGRLLPSAGAALLALLAVALGRSEVSAGLAALLPQPVDVLASAPEPGPLFAQALVAVATVLASAAVPPTARPT